MQLRDVSHRIALDGDEVRVEKAGPDAPSLSPHAEDLRVRERRGSDRVDAGTRSRRTARPRAPLRSCHCGRLNRCRRRAECPPATLVPDSPSRPESSAATLPAATFAWRTRKLLDLPADELGHIRGRHEERVLALEQPHAAVIKVRAVLDRARALFQRQFDCRRAVSVRGNRSQPAPQLPSRRGLRPET